MQSKRFFRNSNGAIGIVVLCLLGAVQSQGQPATSSDDFANKSIEELMNVDVTTVSRKEQKLSKVPAAVYVLTRDEIQRSGATNIPDLLRLVPGVQVAQVEADRWAVSVRGFNASYSNKVLVLIDGRTVYTPTFSGVYWDQIDIPLDTVERIEVVRGSGGAVWGANAVNGVVNIITLHSRNTQGASVTVGSGSHLSEDFEGSFGGKLGSFGTYRIFGDRRDLNGLRAASSPGRPDGWDSEHGGFRMDARLSSKDQLTLDGDVFRTGGGELIAFDTNPNYGAIPEQVGNTGFHALGRWTHTHSDDSESSLQIYDSEYQRHDTASIEQSNTFDIDFQNHSQVGSKQDVVWGLGYRYTSDDDRMAEQRSLALATLGFYIALQPPSKDYSLFSAFLQDEISIGHSVALTVGFKLEHNAFSGFEVEPTVRLGWTLTDRTTLWAAASRSVRQPSRIETGVTVASLDNPLGPGLSVRPFVTPNPNIPAETALTYEAGYRFMPSTRTALDIATFYGTYRDLHVYQPGTPDILPAPGGLIVELPTSFASSGFARNFGSEAALTWNATARWKVAGSYSWLRARARTGATPLSTNSFGGLLPPALLEGLAAGLSTSQNLVPLAGSAPENAFGIQSYFDVSARFAFDQSIFYVGRLEASGIPAYVRLDTHCSYRLRKGLQATLVGQNLLSPRHLEFSEPSQLIATQAERSVFGKLTWSF